MEYSVEDMIREVLRNWKQTNEVKQKPKPILLIFRKSRKS